MRKVIIMTLVALVAMLSLSSCERSEGFETADESARACLNETDLSGFSLCDENVCCDDTIFVGEKIQVLNNFSVEPQKLLGKRRSGNYEVRKFRYKASFAIAITSNERDENLRNQSFDFEAEEVWKDGQKVVEQPFVFESGTPQIDEVVTTEDSKDYRVKIPVTVFNRYDNKDVYAFNYGYNVTQVLLGITVLPWDEVIINVTF